VMISRWPVEYVAEESILRGPAFEPSRACGYDRLSRLVYDKPQTRPESVNACPSSLLTIAS
jgi:hypothetical protein